MAGLPPSLDKEMVRITKKTFSSTTDVITVRWFEGWIPYHKTYIKCRSLSLVIERNNEKKRAT